MSGLTVYSRSGCHLCEFLIDELQPLCAAAGAPLRILDVDVNDAWRDRYGDRVPVVCAGDAELSGWPLDRARICRWLEESRAAAAFAGRHPGG